MYNINGFISSKTMDHLRNVYPYNLLDDIWGRGCVAIDDLLRIDVMKVRDIMENQNVLTKVENLTLYLAYHDMKPASDIADIIHMYGQIYSIDTAGTDIVYMTQSIEDMIRRAKDKLSIALEDQQISIDDMKNKLEKDIKNRDTTIAKLKFQLDMYQEWFKLNGVVDDVKPAVDVFDEPIRAREFGFTIFNALWRGGLRTYGDIMMSSKKQIKKIRNIGKNRLIKILQIMKSYGVNIPDERY